ncbi:carboxypeptidase regulatory-like domain-containing protein, partial [candidate division WOR-3 bacterium]|nr:carboxypeptidase regulatory-like domain-containing protein [candidate division WOR-3 bacterium]
MLCLLFFFVVGSLSQNPVAEGFSLRNPRLANPKGFGYRQEVEKRNELGRHRLSKEERKELLKELAQKRKGRSLQEYGAISGYVTSAKGPIEDVDIDVVDATTHDWVSYGETDATGYYLAEGLPTGSYKLWTWNHQGYVDEWYDNKMYFHEADEVPVNAPDTTKNIDFQLAPGGFIEGTVTSADKGPLEDIDITAYDASDPYPMRGVGGERTDSTGHYIVCLPAGNYKVQTHDWYHGLYVNLYYNNTPYWNTATIVSVTVGDTAKNKDFSLYVGGKIKGTVSGAKGPLYGIGITAFSNTNGEWMAMGESDGDGNYTLPCLPSDNLKLLACPGMQYYKGIDTTHAWEWYNNKGAWTSADVISVSAGDSVLGRDFNLELCGFITGTVSS